MVPFRLRSPPVPASLRYGLSTPITLLCPCLHYAQPPLRSLSLHFTTPHAARVLVSSRLGQLTTTATAPGDSSLLAMPLASSPLRRACPASNKLLLASGRAGPGWFGGGLYSGAAALRCSSAFLARQLVSPSVDMPAIFQARATYYNRGYQPTPPRSRKARPCPPTRQTTLFFRCAAPGPQGRVSWPVRVCRSGRVG